MAIFLGIDGGGTKTTATVASGDTVLGTASAGGCNAARCPTDQARNNLHSAIRDACSAAGVDPAQIEYACIGAAGSSRTGVRELVGSIVREIVPGKVSVVRDMVVAHEAAFLGAPGVVAISGTGSIAFGRNSLGETARAGGWGSVISDVGSGYWIGRQSVAAALRACDAGQSTVLLEKIMSTWGVEAHAEMSRACNTTPPPNYSTLFPVVQAAAVEGDSIAGNILIEAASALANLAKVVARRLWPGMQQLSVAMAGGVFMNSPTIRQAFGHALRAERKNAVVELTTLDPAIGAVRLARKMAEGIASSVEKGR
ncbi:MAG TPA: BadF/BadG/BcrA/BcrD ATPase family protein [Clostridia bacterium]|nr:BadF/BadG/BcrA/BcrD ATPase family protein [Clostridia bacterium]